MPTKKVTYTLGKGDIPAMVGETPIAAKSVTERRKLAAAMIAEQPDLLERFVLASQVTAKRAQITTPIQSYKLVLPYLIGQEHERFVVAVLNRRLKLIDTVEITTGSTGFTIVDPAQILRWALTRNEPAWALIVAHNHPSGDAAPSHQDHEVTVGLAKACRAVNIRLFDHIIVGVQGAWISFAEQGMLPHVPPYEVATSGWTS